MARAGVEGFELGPLGMSDFELLVDLVGRDGGVISLWQMLARAGIVFWYGILLLRVASPRIFSKATPVDIVLSVIIGSILSRAITGDAPLWGVMATAALLVALHAIVMYAANKWRPVANVVKGKPRVLIEDGEIHVREKTRGVIGDRDLMAAIRSAGGERIEDVKLATLERGGEIEVVLKK